MKALKAIGRHAVAIPIGIYLSWFTTMTPFDLEFWGFVGSFGMASAIERSCRRE